MAVYSEKIADNDRKIEQLSKNIKRDTEKRKKLMEENARLSYQAICEQYNCTGQDLLDILSREHQQAISRTAMMNKMPERSQGISPVTDGTIL